MSTKIETVGELLNHITGPDYVELGYFTTILVNTPGEEQYNSVLDWLEYEGERNTEPDKRGVVSTMYTSDDGLVGVLVSYQGERPAKVETNTEVDESDLED
jgi:hypothetical protein